MDAVLPPPEYILDLSDVGQVELLGLDAGHFVVDDAFDVFVPGVVFVQNLFDLLLPVLPLLKIEAADCLPHEGLSCQRSCSLGWLSLALS